MDALNFVSVALAAEYDLAVAGPDAPIVLFTGETAVLAFTAENHGPDAARPADVFVSGPPAVSLTAVTASTGAWSGSDAPAWSVPVMAAGGSAALTVKIRALASGSGTVEVSIAGTSRDFSAANNRLSIPVRVFTDPHFAFATDGGSARFTTEAGVLYTLESSTDLAPGHWTAVATAPGDGTVVTLPLPPAAQRLYFRMRLTAP